MLLKSKKLFNAFLAFMLAFSICVVSSQKKVEAVALVDDTVVVALGLLAGMGLLATSSNTNNFKDGVFSTTGQNYVLNAVTDIREKVYTMGIASTVEATKWFNKLKTGIIDTTTEAARSIWNFFKKELYNFGHGSSDMGLPGITSLPLGVDLLKDARSVSFEYNHNYTDTLTMTDVSNNSKVYLVPLWPDRSNSKTAFLVSTEKDTKITMKFGDWGTRQFSTTDEIGDTGLYYSVVTNIGNTIYWKNSSTDFNFGSYILPLHREINNLDDYVKNVLENHDIDVPNNFTDRQYTTNESIDNFEWSNSKDSTTTLGDEVKLGFLSNSFEKHYTSTTDGSLSIGDTLVDGVPFEKGETIDESVTIPDSIPLPIAIGDKETIEKAKKIKNKNNLLSIFPFCIPYDIYFLCTLFIAEPLPLSLSFPLPDKIINGDFTFKNYEVSLKSYEAASKVCQYMMDIVFVAGLLIITRSLIRG